MVLTLDQGKYAITSILMMRLCKPLESCTQPVFPFALPSPRPVMPWIGLARCCCLSVPSPWTETATSPFESDGTLAGLEFLKELTQ